MSNLEIRLTGQGYSEADALAMKAQIQAYATTNHLSGIVSIIEPL